MKDQTRLTIVRWLLVVCLAGTVFIASRVGIVIYFTYQIRDTHMHRPANAIEVGRMAEPFQNETREVKGMFEIVKNQHRDLELLYEWLGTEAQSAWTLAVIGASLGLALSILLTICLIILPRTKN